jgi:hypothetical protein
MSQHTVQAVLDEVHISRDDSDLGYTPMWQYIAASRGRAARLSAAYEAGEISQAQYVAAVDSIFDVGRACDEVIAEALAGYPGNLRLEPPVIVSAARHSSGKAPGWPERLAPAEAVKVAAFGLDRP